jgi:serine/threonine protein kinase
LEEGFCINGRYDIERSLGAGGFAVVYAGRDTQIDRSVAVKVMNTSGVSKNEEAHGELVERFEREAKLAAKVEHPNVATIFDYGVVDEHEDPFIVMELMKGRDLEEQLVQRGTMEIDRTIGLFCDTLIAIGLAHEAGIVHKDIKPSNLFLKNPDSRFESLSILDFGVAHITQAVQSRLTRAGELMGTPGYVPPEYASDQIVSPALDVYQMGLVLVEALTGEMVVSHPQPPAALFAHVRGELPIPVAYMESPFGQIIRRALAMKPEDRYENGLEFADALAELALEDIPELEAEPETVHVAEYVGERAPAMEGAADAGAAGPAGSANSRTEHLHGEGPAAGAQEAGESKSTQFMYGSDKQTGESESGDTSSDSIVEESPETPHPNVVGEAIDRADGEQRTEIDRAPTAGMEGASEAGRPDSRADSEHSSSEGREESTETGGEVRLDTRFEMDATEVDTETFRQDDSRKFWAGGAIFLLLGGAAIAYFALGVGAERGVAEGAQAAGGSSGETVAGADAGVAAETGTGVAATPDTSGDASRAVAQAEEDASSTGTTAESKADDSSGSRAAGSDETTATGGTAGPTGGAKPADEPADPSEETTESAGRGTDDEPTGDRADETEPEPTPDPEPKEPPTPADETDDEEPAGEPAAPAEPTPDDDGPSGGGSGSDDGSSGGDGKEKEEVEVKLPSF